MGIVDPVVDGFMEEVPVERPPIEEVPMPIEGFIEEDPVVIEGGIVDPLDSPVPNEGFMDEDPVDKLVPIEDPDVDEPIPIPNEGFIDEEPEEKPVLIEGGIVEEGPIPIEEVPVLIEGFIEDPVVIGGFIVVPVLIEGFIEVPVEYPVAIFEGSTVLLDGRTLVVEEMFGLLGSTEEG